MVSDGVNVSGGALTHWSSTSGGVNDINESPIITETTVSDDNLSINVTIFKNLRQFLIQTVVRVL